MFDFDYYASSFDDHIAKSVPCYDGLVKLVCSVSSFYMRAGSVCVDYGCSAGALIGKMSMIFGDSEFIGVDISQNMIDVAKKQNIKNARFVAMDAVTFSTPCNVALSIFVCQFLDRKNRMKFMKNVFESLDDDGVLIIAEKSSPDSGGIFPLAHYDTKLANGFSAGDILKKERELRGHMITYSAGDIEKQIIDSGFTVVTQFWQALQFRAWLCTK